MSCCSGNKPCCNEDKAKEEAEEEILTGKLKEEKTHDADLEEKE